MIQNVALNPSNEDLSNSLNQVINEFNNREKNLIFKNDSGVRTAILNSDGLKTTDGTTDVYGAADSELTFNSNQNVFKIVDIIYTDLASFSLNTGGAVWGSTSSNTTVAHGQSFVPIVMSFAEISGGYWPLPVMFNIVGAGSPYWIKIAEAADSTNVYINTSIIGYNINVTYPAVRIKTYLLQETAN